MRPDRNLALDLWQHESTHVLTDGRWREVELFLPADLNISEVTESRNPDEKGNELMNVPRNTFNLWTTYDLPWNLQIGGGAQYVDSRFSSTLDSSRREAPSYVTFDAMAAWNVNKNFTLRLNVYNLADEEFIDRVGGGHFIPGAGRSATLTASLRF